MVSIRSTDLTSVNVDKSFETAEYFHILFDQLEITFAEGTPVESLYTGKQALQAISQSARFHILAIGMARLGFAQVLTYLRPRALFGVIQFLTYFDHLSHSPMLSLTADE